MIPGETLPGSGSIAMNAGRDALRLEVENHGDRPIQVGSHYHFAESNPALEFDRQAAWGRRLDIPPGTSVRFEPGAAREIELVRIGGRRRVPGLRRVAAGALDGR